jgi:outer membrane protein assembly factor BamD (BamD/ComL family)
MPRHASGRHPTLRTRALAILAGVAAFAASSVALAQNRYILSEDDTWAAEETLDSASPEGQLARARRTLAQGDFVRAQELATNWIDRHENHPLLPEAYLIRADALVGQKDEYKALYDYEYVIRGYPGTEAFVIANQRELEIAKKYAAGMRRKLWGIRFIDARDDAQELLIRIQERLPGSQLAEQAGMELADYYFKRREMALAAEAYLLFTQNYPKSTQISKARRRVIYSYLAAFKGPQFDISGLIEAKAKLQELQVVEPATAEQVGAEALLIHIDEADAEKMFTTAKWYAGIGDYLSAEFQIRRLVKKHPRSAATVDALRLIPSILPRLPEGVRRTLPNYDAMRAALFGAPAAEPASPFDRATLEVLRSDSDHEASTNNPRATSEPNAWPGNRDAQQSEPPR